ncbi:mitotic checkpoint protein BUB3.3 [Citrus sinensis]|nr:mitotic checkpoint protein BUB3.3 [Citrus sinensis]
MAISGDLRVAATLASYHQHPLRSSLPSSKNLRATIVENFISFILIPLVDFAGFPSEITPKWPGMAIDNCSMRQSKLFSRISGDYKLSPNPISHEVESFLLNAINMSFFDRLNLAWKIVFPSPTTRRNSNARIAKQRLQMILFSDRCAVSDEAKRKIVNNIVHALSDFVEIESQDKVQLNVSTDTDLGTIYSVTVPVRRVKPEYLDSYDVGTIANVEYKDTGETSGSVDVSLRLYDVDSSQLRLESPGEPPLLDCCFQNDAVVFTAASDGFIRRCDLHLGINDAVGNHDDIATCLQFSEETSQVVTAGLDKKIMFWDIRMGRASGNLDADVASMSLSGYDLIVAVGASVNMYDLRYLGRSVQSSELRMDVQIKCVSSNPYSRGHVVGSIDGRVAVEISHPSDSNNSGYMFRCHPKSKDGRHHLVPVNDVVFSPLSRGAFVTGDNEGYVAAWDAQSRRRLFELPRFSNSVASLSYNHGGQLLAVASSCTYQEATAIEETPQIFIIRIDDIQQQSACVGSSSRH